HAMTATVTRSSPGDATECSQILAQAAADRRTVRIQGSGTKSYLGDVGTTDIELGTERVAGVIDHVPADLTVTVGAGTRMADLKVELGRAGQLLHMDPPHAAEATVGGVIAAHSTAFWRTRFVGGRAPLHDRRTDLTA